MSKTKDNAENTAKNKGQQELLFPEGIYNNISEYYEAQVKVEEGH